MTSPMTVASTSHLSVMAMNCVEVLRLDDGHHAFLRLRHEDLLRLQARVAQRDEVELDLHAAVAVGGELAGGTGEPGAAEVLDAVDDTGRVEVEAALDEHLLGERVADLDGRALGRAALVEGLGGEHRDAADAVAAGLGAEEDDLVADTGRLGEVDVLDAHRADAEGVDERVALVAVVEDDLAADVGQADAVAVAADARDDARAGRAGCRGGAGCRSGAGP